MTKQVFHLARRAVSRASLRLRPRRTLGYIGWAGHSNLGDEALFAAIASLFSGHYLAAYSGGRTEAFLRHCGLGAQQCMHGILLGGGTLINSGYLSTANQAIEEGVPFFAFGTGVGSAGFACDASDELNGWQSILAKACLVGVRGPRSQSKLLTLGLSNVEIIGDPALSLTADDVPTNTARPRLLVNLSAPSPGLYGRGPYRMYRAVARIAARFAKDGGEVIAIALGQNDKGVLTGFVRDAGLPQETVVEVRNSPSDFLHLAAGSTLLVGVRLHAAILACCLGVPALLFGYRDKCHDFMDSMGLSKYLLELSPEKESSIFSAFDEALSDRTLPRLIHQRALEFKHLQSSFAQRVMDALP